MNPIRGIPRIRGAGPWEVPMSPIWWTNNVPQMVDISRSAGSIDPGPFGDRQSGETRSSDQVTFWGIEDLGIFGVVGNLGMTGDI